MHIGCFGAGSLKVSFHSPALFVQNVSKDYFRSFVTEQLRFDGTLTPGATAYQRYFSVQPSHDGLLLVRCNSGCSGNVGRETRAVNVEQLSR